MKHFLRTLILSSFLFLVFSSSPRRYTINIDQPLEPQYARIFTDYKQALANYVTYINSIKGVSIMKALTRIVSLFQPKEWREKIAMFSRISGYSEEILILGNLSYEIFCTSIVIRNENGKVFMGRNLDFPGKDVLAKLAYEISAVRGGKLIYVAASIVGSTGIMNGLVPGKFAVSINKRNTSTTFKNLLRFALGYKSPEYYMQEVLEKAESYESAFSMLKTENLSSPAYYIIGGVKEGEGAVIARDYDKEVLVDTLNSKQWFLVQTNYDRDQEDPQSDFRRVPAENKIKAIGKSINITSLYETVMHQSPNFREDTIWTTIQYPNETLFNTTVYDS